MDDGSASGWSEAHPAATLPRALGWLRVALDDAFVRASRDLNLTPQQAELLCAAMTRPAAVGEIADVLRCDRSNVTRLVDRAASRGLVRRGDDEDDGRVSRIALSPDGERLAHRFIAALEAQTEELRAAWPTERLQATVASLNEIAAALDHGRPPRGRPLRGADRRTRQRQS